jgi:hypothetical protein
MSWSHQCIITVFLSVYHYACKVVIIGNGRESNAWKNLWNAKWIINLISRLRFISVFYRATMLVMCVWGERGFFVFNYLKKNYIFILCLNHICSDWTKVHIRQGPLSHEAYSSNTCYQTYNEFPRERTHTSSIPHEFKQWEFSIVLKYYYFGLH